MKRASIDIGSNSILLLLGEFDGDEIKILENESNITGLGRDLDKNGVFLDIAMEESFNVFQKYKEICEKHDLPLDKVVVTATEASRVAKNAKDFFKKVKNEIGFEVKIISGEAEAYYSTTGILFDKKIQDEVITIMDIGGASTELIKVDVQKKEILTSFSMPAGAVRMNNWNEEGSRETNLSKVLTDYSSQIEEVKTPRLYCVAGTMTSVGNMFLGEKSFVEKEVNGLSFKSSEVETMINDYLNFKPSNFLEEFPFLGKRSKTIMSGLVLANEVIKKLESEELYISTYGLRYGTLLAGEIKNEFISK